MNLGSLLGSLPLPIPPGLPGLGGMGGSSGGSIQSPGFQGYQAQPQGDAFGYQQNLLGLMQLMGQPNQQNNMNLISGGGLI